MAMSALSVVFSVFVLSFHHRGALKRGPPRWIKNLTKCVSKILCGGVQFSSDKTFQINGLVPSQNIHPDNYSQGLPEYDALLAHEIQNLNHVDAQSFQNGMNSSHPTAQAHTHVKFDSISMRDEIMKYFTTVAVGHEKILDEKRTIHDWQEVARVLDKVFFWTFLLVTVSSSLALLVISPMTKEINIDDYIT